MGKFYSLVRIISVEETGVRAILPGWNPREEVMLKSVPPAMYEGKNLPCRVRALVNLGAEEANELDPEQWDDGDYPNRALAEGLDKVLTGMREES